MRLNLCKLGSRDRPLFVAQDSGGKPEIRLHIKPGIKSMPNHSLSCSL